MKQLGRRSAEIEHFAPVYFSCAESFTVLSLCLFSSSQSAFASVHKRAVLSQGDRAMLQ